jgi:hypothetical protein
VGVLQEEERIGDAIGAPVFNQSPLQLEAVGVADQPEPTHVERRRSAERTVLVAKR